MKFRLGTENYQIRVNDRRVVKADVLQHGEVVASGEAILNPVDEWDRDKANSIAIGRALKKLPGEGRIQVQRDIVRRLKQHFRPEFYPAHYGKVQNVMGNAAKHALVGPQSGQDASIAVGGSYGRGDPCGIGLGAPTVQTIPLGHFDTDPLFSPFGDFDGIKPAPKPWFARLWTWYLNA